MARAPDPRIEQAKELYLAGEKLIEIARQLDLPEGTVRRWKCTHKWDKADTERSERKGGKKSERSDKKIKNKKHKVLKPENELLVNRVLENSELTGEQQLFCVLYAKTLNATQSYKKAYGCSYNAALASGSRLLGKDRIKEEIQRLKKERFETQLFDEHDIFQWYLDVATAAMTDFADFGRSGVILKESTEVDGRAIRKVSMGKYGPSIELYDAMRAMEWLGEHMNMGTNAQQGLAKNIMDAWEKRKHDEGQRMEDINAG